MGYLSPDSLPIHGSLPPTVTNGSFGADSVNPTIHTNTDASTAKDCVGHFISDLAFNASSRLLYQPCNATLPSDETGGAAGQARGDAEPFLFDRGDVRGVLITLYTAVFVTGFVGEYMRLCLAPDQQLMHFLTCVLISFKNEDVTPIVYSGLIAYWLRS